MHIVLSLQRCSCILCFLNSGIGLDWNKSKQNFLCGLKVLTEPALNHTIQFQCVWQNDRGLVGCNAVRIGKK